MAIYSFVVPCGANTRLLGTVEAPDRAAARAAAALKFGTPLGHGEALLPGEADYPEERGGRDEHPERTRRHVVVDRRFL